jgi:hypothetical protein
MVRRSKNLYSLLLVVLGFASALLFLQLGVGGGPALSPVLIMQLSSPMSDATWDVYARYGAVGVFFGLVVPTCAFAAAAAIWLSRKV